VTRPFAGLQAFHNGRPVELLHFVRDYAEGHDIGQVWLVKPIFVENHKVREELFRIEDTLTPIHTAPRRAA
jgi:hypothetical protein